MIENIVEPEMKFRCITWGGKILTAWKRSASDPNYWLTVELPVYAEFKFSDSTQYEQVKDK